MKKTRFYFTNQDNISRIINPRDLLLLTLVFLILFFFAWAGKQMATPYALGSPITISLAPQELPFYASRTVLRMFIALFFSIIVTFIFGTLAAKSKKAEQIIIPAVDILQSIPVLSFLAITVTGFIHLFPGSLLGPECASIFVIFTAQVWNMIFSFYQSLKTIPSELHEVTDMYQLSPWQRFWKLEVPFALPGLLWNMMMSMSASWFFVVLSEAISVAHQEIRLPGVGSYIAMAIQDKSLLALFYAILTMVIVIFIYDQLLFRPLIAWSEKFRMEQTPGEDQYESWFLDLLRNSRIMNPVYNFVKHFKNIFINNALLRRVKPKLKPNLEPNKQLNKLWNTIVIAAIVFGSYILLSFILSEVKLSEFLHVLALGAVTGTRVIILIILSSLLWIPVGVWIGRRAHLVQKVQPIIQFLAAFPANLFYPLFVIAIVHFNLNVNIWITPLMILGTQWYILFNVIAGSTQIPRDLYLAADNFGVKGWQWWRTLALPGIFPYYITGAIAAAGGAWNASIVAEWVSWGNITLKATGLGEYITANTNNGDFPKIALGTAMMCIYVLAFNRIIWRPLYRLAEERFNMN